MFNAASKLSFTAGAAAAVAGFAAVLATSDRVAFSALVFAGAMAVVIGIAIFYFAPRDPVVPVSAEVEAATVRSVDVTDVPRGSPWPLLAAVAVTLLGVGAAMGKSLIVPGVILAVIAAFAWLGQVWREHPSWTQAMTDRMNDRFVVPIGLPGTVILLAGIAAVSLSRIFLAVSADAAPAIGIVIAFAILGSFYLLSTRESVSRGVLVTLAAVAAVLVLGAGLAGALKGEREFHEASGEGGHGGTELSGAELKAEDLAFDPESLQLPANTEVVVTLENADGPGVPHNFSVYTEEGGDELFKGDVVNGGETAEYAFTTPEAGSYYFQCDVHPADMNGTLEVVEDASAGDATDNPSSNPSTTSTTEP